MLRIVMPVYNDWVSATQLVRHLDRALNGRDWRVQVIAVDDGSIGDPPAAILGLTAIELVEVVELETNLGHQRAIATGLVHAYNSGPFDRLAIMDSDGEDTPEALLQLLDAAEADDGAAIVAQRSERSEGPVFRLFYQLYVRLFQLLTGKRINFGNFMVLPAAHVRRLVHVPNIWNNIAATLVHSRLPTRYIPTTRGKRYAGESGMGFVGLVLHGLGAISVFAEIVFVRMLIASLAVLASAAVGAVIVVALKFLTDTAIPGWATNVMGFLVSIGFQAAMVPVLLAFIVLGNRSSIQVLPIDMAPRFIRDCRALHGAMAHARAAAAE
jgi:polyisoprenyl-phosphate glycosyltransferase